MPHDRRTEFNRLIDALRHLDDSQLLSAWKRTIHIHELAKPGRQRVKATKRLKACEMIVGERFRSDEFGEQPNSINQTG